MAASTLGSLVIDQELPDIPTEQPEAPDIKTSYPGRVNWCSDCSKRVGAPGTPKDFRPRQAVDGGCLCETCGSRWRDDVEKAREASRESR